MRYDRIPLPEAEQRKISPKLTFQCVDATMSWGSCTCICPPCSFKMGNHCRVGANGCNV